MNAKRAREQKNKMEKQIRHKLAMAAKPSIPVTEEDQLDVKVRVETEKMPNITELHFKN